MAELREVSKKASIHMQGHEYFSVDFVPYIGKQVKAFVDVDYYDAVCFDVDTGELITNVHNPELWAEMTANMDQHNEFVSLIPLLISTTCFITLAFWFVY